MADLTDLLESLNQELEDLAQDLEELSELKLGSVPDDVIQPAIEFANILAEFENEVEAIERATQAEPLAPAPEMDYLSPFESWHMLGNNRYNDCVSVTWANMRRLITSKLSGREVYPSMTQVMQLYKTQVTDANPEVGMNVFKLLEELEKNGGPDGVRALAFARVDLKDSEQVRRALAIFGALWVEIKVHMSNKEEFDYQQVWQVPPKSSSFAGQHSVLCGGCTKDGNLKIVTWGRVAELSLEYVRQKGATAYVVIWPEHFGSRRFTRGINLASLRREYEHLTKRELLLPPPKLNSVLMTFKDPEETTGKEYLQIKKVEPSIGVDQEQRYGSECTRSVTPVPARIAETAILAVDNDDLYLIRTKDTPSNRVEIQCVLGPQYYELDSTMPLVTAFKCSGSSRGGFCVDNGDLYFIRLPKVGDANQKLEVHHAPREKRFRIVDKYVTGLDLPEKFDRAKDRVAISGGDLYVLMRGSEYLEVICVRGNANYSDLSQSTQVTCIRSDEMSTFYTVGLNGDLYMLKHDKTNSSYAEVWISSSADAYAKIQKHVTTIAADDSVDAQQVSGQSARRWII